MNYDWINNYALSKRGVTKDYKEEWGCDRYFIGGKMFQVIGTHKDGRKIITLKCEPDFGMMLRQNYEDIIAGYYMNKQHWNTVYMDGNVPNEIIKSMIDMSYTLIFTSLTKKMQKEIKVEQS